MSHIIHCFIIVCLSLFIGYVYVSNDYSLEYQTYSASYEQAKKINKSLTYRDISLSIQSEDFSFNYKVDKMKVLGDFLLIRINPVIQSVTIENNFEGNL